MGILRAQRVREFEAVDAHIEEHACLNASGNQVNSRIVILCDTYI